MRMMIICNKEVFAKAMDRSAFAKDEIARSTDVEVMKGNLLVLSNVVLAQSINSLCRVLRW